MEIVEGTANETWGKIREKLKEEIIQIMEKKVRIMNERFKDKTIDVS